MIYLTTGANGSGKTLLTLRDVREQQLKENRPVYFHGFQAGAKIIEFGWKEFEPKDWQSLPDGSILLMDECQNEFPLRRAGSEVPDYINAIAQHRRKRGFDMWMITPHPLLLDVFVRRLIDNPSWHRHLKRVAGANMVSVLKWNAVKGDCEKNGSGESGEVTMVPYPREVFGWYESASLHTGKRKIPRAVYVVLVAALVVPVLAYFAFKKVTTPAPSLASRMIGPSGAASGPVGRGGSFPSAKALPGTADATREYVAARVARLPGFPNTAAAFDSITAPRSAPYPAACLEGKPLGTGAQECRCYTQQGTLLQTPADLCRQIVQQGYFIEWHQEASVGVGARAIAPGASAPAPVVPVALPASAVASGDVAVFVPPLDSTVAPVDLAAQADGRMIRNMRGGMRSW